MLTISSTTKEKVPISTSYFKKALKTVLGKRYSLELIFVGGKRMRTLNLKYRKKDKTTDILSFEMEKNLGMMFINLQAAKKKSVLFDRTHDNYLKFLFIHGLCHLKGMDHGSRMENKEKKFRKLLQV